MSAVGFDLGNQSCVVAVARQRGIDVLFNESEIPALVCFDDAQCFGTAAATSMMNPKNTIFQIKRLIGRPFSDPELQQDLKSLPFSVTEGPDGFPLINAQYLGETKSFTPTQVLGMVFSNMKTIAEKKLKTEVVDCCIGIPIYFTDLQRRAVMDAATIAGLHPLRLMHETTATATALAYEILYNADLPENEQLNVAFVDIGHASMQVCIAGCKRGHLKILAHSFDRCLGGRDFDEVLFQHFAEKFKGEYKIDVFQNARACLRLRAACEKLKKVLSENPEASLNIECLMDDHKDVRAFIKRDEFEEISAPILERVKKPLEKALLEAQLTIDDIYAVEVVGSGSRVPAVIKILAEFFGKDPRCTMKAKRSVSRGCTYECANRSSAMKEFMVQDNFPFPIAFTLKGLSQDSQNGNVDRQQSVIAFTKGNPIPSVKSLTFNRTGTFTVGLQYADVSELQAPAEISTYTIGPFQTTNGERGTVKVRVRLDLHGIVSVESAQLIEDEKVEIPVKKEATKMDRDKVPADVAADVTPVDMASDVNVPDASVAENGAPETGDTPLQMETDAKVEATANPSSDPNSPYYIHPNDYPRQIHVNESLNDSNYAYWSREMKDFLLATNKTGFIDGTILQPAENSKDSQPWQRSNAMIKGWLTTAMEKEIRDSVKYRNTAKEIWDDLEERFGKESAPRVFELKRALRMTRQEALSVSAYYTKMRGLWDEIEAVSPLPKCTCGKCTCDLGKRLIEGKDKEKVYEFLMGLEDVFSTVKAKILNTKPMPSLESVYHLVAEDEQQRPAFQTPMQQKQITEKVWSVSMWEKWSYHRGLFRENWLSRVVVSMINGLTKNITKPKPNIPNVEKKIRV